MKRVVGLLGLLAIAFYAAWPAYSGYQIKTALEAKDPATLEAKVDFPSVRESLRPVVAAKVEDSLKELLKAAGPDGAALLDQMRQKMLPQIVDGTLTKLVTAENIITVHAEGRSIKESLEKIVKDETSKGGGLGGVLAGLGTGGQLGVAPGTLDKLKDLASKSGIDPGKVLGGLFGKTDQGPAPPPAPETATDATAKTGPKYGLGNIKHVGLNGPLGFNVGVAKDAAATEADLIAGMSFVNGDWKLTSLVPRL